VIERGGLAARLRADTAYLHKSTEATLALPDAVRSREDYARLLRTSLAFYSAAQVALDDPRWVDKWDALGITTAVHDRVPQLTADLRDLGDESMTPEGHCVAESFPEALGVLYVVEGSSLGGRFIGPAIIASIGPVPTSFYASEGRQHPKPWRSVLSALAAFDGTPEDEDAVVAGASNAFIAFGEIVAVA
jgi:heme oxygenase